MKVVMIGTGYVGLVSGTCFAEFGAEVVCVDVDAAKIEKLENGKIPIYEPGLEEMVADNVRHKRLRFSTDYSHIGEADLVFIAVGTPSRHGDGYADLTYVYQAARDIATNLQGYTVIVDKSTVPVGTARNVKRIIGETNPAADFDVASNPEFLREGAAISDFMRPDRVVLGVESERAKKLLHELYRPLNLIEAPILTTDLESAELIKYASNAFLATKISFINEMSVLCEAVGADVHAIAKGMGLDNRIGKKFLHVGPGYGGSCFPKDTQALVRIAQEHGASSRIVESVIEVNSAQKARMVKKIRAALDNNVSGKTIAVLGLTFKPETDDMRDSPALSIIPNLIEQGARIRAHDPQGMEEAARLLPKEIEFCDDAYSTLDQVDAVVILTEWNEYRGLSLDKLKQLMRGNVFIDLRNIYEPETVRDQGFRYTCIGRP
ncbi:UDPglucose 6-dehydrogenase [Methylohalomonas lacus]|uniref:UDP-glucose 6-dehydrogenase n=1 Tax=Methylohalomonas lacus TaxID=398773 RepID=A0AAE3HME0_9GAMM|nr:UDP-glucose/GDP-mannose dehydrogenase family protein [Methylohalomonas lacus]MCS3904520.1 UDPglucose 6-dehydrogenase [Methylohalomonas lacus]